MRTLLNRSELACTDVGHGEALVFLHGFPFHRELWKPQVQAFKSHYRVIAPDLRGFGASDATGNVTAMADFAEDLHDLAATLGLGRFVLIGHSMGGYVALSYAHRYPESLRALVLLGTRSGPDSPEAAAARRALADRTLQAGTDEVIQAMAARMLASPHPPASLQAEVRRLMGASGPPGLAAALRGMAARPDAGPWLGDIQVPTLVITGEEDAIMPPAEAEALARAIPGATLARLPGAGHLAGLEHPEAFNDLLRHWLDNLF